LKINSPNYLLTPHQHSVIPNIPLNYLNSHKPDSPNSSNLESYIKHGPKSNSDSKITNKKIYLYWF